MFTVMTLKQEILLVTPDFLTACEAMQSRQSMPLTDDRAHIDVEMNYANAVGFLKALKGYDWFVRVQIWAPKTVAPTRGFNLTGSVRATRIEALRILDSAYGTRFKAECNVRFTIHPRAVFIG